MTYKQEKQDYDNRIKTLKRITWLDEGPDKGIPIKVAAVYLLEYSNNLKNYISKECLAIGPLEANLNSLYAIKGQNDDYNIYLLDKELDPNQEIVILQRGCTARIIRDYGVVLSFNYNCTPLAARSLAATLATLTLNKDTTIDKVLVHLLHPKKDERETDF
ncbi:hypothetical protein HCX91_09880 [Limosilactobacillus fermentum]